MYKIPLVKRTLVTAAKLCTFGLMLLQGASLATVRRRLKRELSGAQFEIDFELAGGAAARVVMFVRGPAEVMAFARANIQPNSELYVSRFDFSWDLQIEGNAQGSYKLRALEHRGFFVESISEDQALAALEYWLPSQDRTPDLQWEDE